MSHSLRADLPSPQRKSVARATLRGETPRKEFAGIRIGAVIERAIHLSGMTKQQAAGEMGYADPSALSRWIAGTDDVQFERMWAVLTLRAGLLAALAESAGHQVRVRTLVEIERTA